MDYNRINRYLLKKQHLIKREKPAHLITIAADLLGLHATINKTPYLSLFIRKDHFQKDEYTLEFNDKKSLGKIRSVRRTIFVYPRSMISWIYAATKELYMPRLEQYFAITGLTREEYETYRKQICTLLKQKSLTAAEIRKELKVKKSLSMIINLLCDQGELIRGPSKSWKSSTYRYSLFSDYFPDIDVMEYSPYDAQTRLFDAYLDSYGPATVSDICWWSGLTARVREYIASNKKRLAEITCGNNTVYYILKKNQDRLIKTVNTKQEYVILLPAHDPFIMGYKERNRYLDTKWFYNVFDKGGNSTSVILKNGRIIGVWDCFDKPGPLVKLFFFQMPCSPVLKKAKACALKMGEFILENEPNIETCEHMTLLSDRTMGGFMSPLKENL